MLSVAGGVSSVTCDYGGSMLRSRNNRRASRLVAKLSEMQVIAQRASRATLSNASSGLIQILVP